jgi:hypothetical protein
MLAGHIMDVSSEECISGFGQCSGLYSQKDHMAHHPVSVHNSMQTAGMVKLPLFKVKLSERYVEFGFQDFRFKMLSRKVSAHKN